MARVDPQKFIPLKTQRFHIMLSLAGGEQPGYEIMQEVLNRTTGKVRLWPATLYGSIKRLIEAELVAESQRAARTETGRRTPPLLPAGGSWQASARRGM